jgi:cytochrome P450
MNKGFSPAVAESLRPQIEAIVDRMLEPLRHASEAEFMHEIAHPLPVNGIAEMLGIPDTMQSQLVRWSDALATFLGNPRRTLEQTKGSPDGDRGTTQYFREIVIARRRKRAMT